MMKMGSRTGGLLTRVSACLLVSGISSLAGSGVEPPEAIEQVPETEIEWITIGDINNPPIERWRTTWRVIGRGSVSYEYRISKYEVTTAQWMEFVNTFSTQGGDLTFFGWPSFWGGRVDPDYTGPGRRYILRDEPDAAMMPVFGISWRDAARYCNWLHNDKGSSLAAIADGAYDTSTFVDFADGTFLDQHTRNPGARFWIPSWDEWLKAAHYNPEIRMWQKWPTMRNRPLVPGVPGVGETSADILFSDCADDYTFCPYDIPLGAYDTVSPYGLYDVSGGTTEWTEEILQKKWRITEGVYAGGSRGFNNRDAIFYFDSWRPWQAVRTGLRVAGSVPVP
jgi:sulfatase-modifying factor enzyme 1